jgi:peptide/nickel transport system ATP-binding protein
VLHGLGGRREALERATYLLERVGVTPAARRLGQFPHELSGGLRQRTMIAMALMCAPRILIADEPTTALDVTVQAQVLRLLRELQAEFELGVLLITHDLGVVARTADSMAVMYAGEFVETGSVADVFGQPRHPYTKGLIASVPAHGGGRGGHLSAIPGTVPSMAELPVGCAFANRCAFVQAECRAGPIAMRPAGPGHAVRCVLVPQAAGAGAAA